MTEDGRWMEEKDLAFDFTRAISFDKLDERGKPTPQGMLLADFVVEERRALLIVEVKDPSHCQAPEEQRRKWLEKMRTNALVNEQLTPTARDSYAYLHLMERDEKPMKFIVLLGAERLKLGSGELSNLRERLLGRLRKEADEPWKRKYIQECVVLDVSAWERHFPQYPVKRLSDDL